MAWNKPKSGEAASSPLQGKGGTSSLLKRRGRRFPIVAGAIVVLGAAVAAWLLWPNGESADKTPPPQTRQRIKEVTPAPAPKAEEPPCELTADEKRLKEIADIEERWAGKKMPVGIKTHLYYLKNLPKKTISVKSPYGYLRHTSERDIAGVGLAKPGAYFVVLPEYGESFDNDFIAALVDRIDASPDDTEEVREMKRAVEDLKHEIAKICREEGKKPSEVMNEHARAMYELGHFQENLEQELSKVRENPDISDEDVKDFFAAANAMLKNKGLEEMKIPDLTYRSLFLQLKNQHQINKGKEE